MLTDLAGDRVAHEGLDVGDRLGVVSEDGIEELLPERGSSSGVVVEIHPAGDQVAGIGRQQIAGSEIDRPVPASEQMWWPVELLDGDGYGAVRPRYREQSVTAT